MIAYRLRDWTHFGKWEKQIRKKKNITLTDLAFMCGYKSTTTFSQYEQNKVNPSLENMLKITEKLGYEIVLREKR